MKNKVKYHSFVFVLFLVFASCKYEDKASTNIMGTDTLLTKTIFFPGSLKKLEGDHFKEIDSFRFEIEEKNKIVSIVDGVCMKCVIEQLNIIDSTFNSILPDDSGVMIFILNVSKADSAYFMLNLRPAIKAKGVILWDNNYDFERQNHLFTSNSNLRTFMTDGENKIIQYGNPVMHPDVISKYQEKLEN